MAEERRVFFTRPPHGDGTSDRQKVQHQAVTAASATAVAIGAAEDMEYGVFMCTTLCHIRFGLSTVGAATANDMTIPANTFVRWELKKNEETHFSVIRDAADGVLFWYLPG